MRRVRLRAVVAGLTLTSLAGCAGNAQLADLAIPLRLPAVVELDSTPFYPQSEQQCGPAALATLLEAAGHAAPLDRLQREIFVPGRQGSLQPELVAAIRARGLLPYESGGDLGGLMADLAAGHPVLVLQKQGFGPWPAWHYAVAIGYDSRRETVVLRSGTTERLELRAAVFDATWGGAERWALVALEPGRMPARPDLERYLRAAASLEAVGQLDGARDAFAAAADHWPDQPMPRLGLANVDAARGHWSEAERGYRAVLELEPRLAAALNNRAEALSRLGCHAVARDVLERGAARIDPDDPLRPALSRTLADIQARAAVAEAIEPDLCARLGQP
ncbi:MAG: uncharacterized protein K0R70_674 [Steroidobacteraceae bacterium]|nr:uncharacterized protein [Steroidobacteraceae bacterium]